MDRCITIIGQYFLFFASFIRGQWYIYWTNRMIKKRYFKNILKYFNWNVYSYEIYLSSTMFYCVISEWQFLTTLLWCSHIEKFYRLSEYNYLLNYGWPGTCRQPSRKLISGHPSLGHTLCPTANDGMPTLEVKTFQLIHTYKFTKFAY